LVHVARNANAKVYTQIPNPCGEISLNILGGYCVIADVVPYFAPTIDDAEEAFRAATRALIRVNTMDALYGREVKRTNRIGVGMTGIHEFAWNQFGYSFRDIIDEEKSKDFFQKTISHEYQKAQQEYQHLLEEKNQHISKESILNNKLIEEQRKIDQTIKISNEKVGVKTEGLIQNLKEIIAIQENFWQKIKQATNEKDWEELKFGLKRSEKK